MRAGAHSRAGFVLVDHACLPESPHNQIRPLAQRISEQMGWPAEAVPRWLLTGSGIPWRWRVVTGDTPTHNEWLTVRFDPALSLPEVLEYLPVLLPDLARRKSRPLSMRSLLLVIWVEEQRLWPTGVLPSWPVLYAWWQQRWGDIDVGPGREAESAAWNTTRKARRYTRVGAMKQAYDRIKNVLLAGP